MKNKMLSIAGGFFSAAITVVVVNSINQYFYPLPPNLSNTNRLALELYLAYMPAGAFAITFIGMALGGIAGGFTATMIDAANGKQNALVIAVIFTFFGIAGMLMVTHPLKLWIINLFTYIPCAVVGNKIALTIKIKK